MFGRALVVAVALLVAGADAIIGRPRITSGGKAAPANPLFGKTAASKKAAKSARKSEAIPFLDAPPKLDGTMLMDIGFDPLGLSNTWDLNYLRAAEIKHGRVGMLASLGFLVQEGYRLPGPASNPELFSAPKTPLEALAMAPPLGLAQIVFVIFLIELATSRNLLSTEATFEDDPKGGVFRGSDAIPGDLGFDPLGLALDGVKEEYAIAELKHGRLGMLGAAGMLAGSLVSGKSITEQTYDWLGLPFNG